MAAAKFDETTDIKNQMITRYYNRSTLLFSENLYMVSAKDLAKDQTFENFKIKPLFVGKLDGAKYVIINFADFSKILDKEGFKKDLMNKALQSVREDPSEDDYFKMLYSNTLRHLAYIVMNFDISVSIVTREFIERNINVFEPEDRKKILTKIGGDIFAQSN